jgi:hypothetical protein
MGARMRRNLRSPNLPRRGAVAPLVIFALGAMLCCFAFAVNKAWLWSVREDLKLSADASALGAAAALVDDDLLRGNTSLYPLLLGRAMSVGREMAGLNPVRRQALGLLANPDNAPGGDIVFGRLTTPRAGDFTTVPGLAVPDPSQGQTNTVVVTARQTRSRGNAPGLIFGVFAGVAAADVAATSAATLDRGIRGFRPLYGPTPLAPVALLSTPGGANPLSWEAQVETGAGPDAVAFVPGSGAFAPGPDGIHEFVAVYPTEPDQLPAANVALTFLGHANLGNLGNVIDSGFTGDDLQGEGRQIVLPEAGGRSFPGQTVGPSGGSPPIVSLYLALERLRQSAEVRIWPLYGTAVGSDVVVTGFVAARVVSVTPPLPDQPFTFTLQATLIARPDAVTDTDLRGAGATMNGNRYLTKIRRVE